MDIEIAKKLKECGFPNIGDINTKEPFGIQGKTHSEAVANLWIELNK